MVVAKLGERGEVMHLAKSGRLIVRLAAGSKETKNGELLVDANGKPIGKVIEIIGPVNAPYASVAPMTDRINKIIGIKVFSGGFLPKRRVSRPKNYRQDKNYVHNSKVKR
jgi:RNA-binding protein